MRKRFTVLAVALIWAALTFSRPAAAQTELTFSLWLPPTHPISAHMIVPWIAEVEKASQGRVRIKILPKALGSPGAHFDIVRDGLADVMFTVHGYAPGRFVLTKVAEFPFLGESAEATSVAYWRIFEKYLAKANEHKGMKVLSLFTHGPGVIFNSKHPVTKVADLAGLKIRVGGGIVNDVAKALGTVPLLKPAPESYELLSNGVADGVFFPGESVKSFKLEKLVKYATQVPGGLYNTSFVLAMNEAKFKSLSEADQDAIMSVSGEHFARLAGKAWDVADRDGLASFKAAGGEVITASPAFVADIKARTASLEVAWEKEAKAKGVDGAAILAAFRAEIKKVEGK